MGAKYDYLAAFRHDPARVDWAELLLDGFDAMWSRFGPPRQLSVQNYVSLPPSTMSRIRERRLAEALPPGENELVVIYDRKKRDGRGALLSFNLQGPYLLACASVDAYVFAERGKHKLFDEFTKSLQRFRPLVLVAGEELAESAALVDRVLRGELAPIPQFGAELATVYESTASDDEASF